MWEKKKFWKILQKAWNTFTNMTNVLQCMHLHVSIQQSNLKTSTKLRHRPLTCSPAHSASGRPQTQCQERAYSFSSYSLAEDPVSSTNSNKQGHQSSSFSGSKNYYYKVVNINCGKTIKL